MTDARQDKQGVRGLSAYLSPLGAWSLAVGTSIGWGSLVITANTYLVQAGPRGSVLGMLLGMLVMLVVARNYAYMMGREKDSGGVYAYARDTFGFDHGVLTAWFLCLTYLAMFWANATSLPLFARYFVGSIFQVGFSYHLFDYQVYLGEALLSIAVILLAGVFCMRHRRAAQSAMIGLALTFVVGICICFGVAAFGGGVSGQSLEPAYVPDVNPFSQVFSIACMSSWAFIGFESISHSSEEFTFSPKKSLGVLVAALVSSALLYVFVTLLSASAHPSQYANWLEYISDLGNCQGIESLPAFYAAQSYLGAAGVQLLMLSLLALIATSLIGNIVALSRLLYSLARDEVIPYRLASLNSRGIPDKAIGAILVVSVFMPFLGRTVIGWVVDVTTLGATIVYGFISACAYRTARNAGDHLDESFGAVGVVLMVLSGVFLLLPSLLSTGSMAKESYFLFTIWAIVGFLFFRFLLKQDSERRFGKSVVAWIVLLSLILFTSLAWFGQISSTALGQMAERVQGYYSGSGPAADLALSEADFMDSVTSGLNGSISHGIALVGGLFMFSLCVMLSNFAILRQREDESCRIAAGAQSVANRDALTGVKSKHAYVTREAELNEHMDEDDAEEFALVVCDVNGLKQVNDTLGHKAGDEYIRAASTMVCQMFKHSPVFRIGGDEFVVVLQGQDYEDREQVVAALDAQSVANIQAGKVVVAVGLATFEQGVDHQVSDVFERADEQMYARKKGLKLLQGLPAR